MCITCVAQHVASLRIAVLLVISALQHSFGTPFPHAGSSAATAIAQPPARMLAMCIHCASLCIAYRSTKLPSGASLDRLKVEYSTALISSSERASLNFCADHPTDLRPETADAARWPHLPKYDDYLVYINNKAQSSLLAWMESDPRMATSSMSTIFLAAGRWSTLEPGVAPQAGGF